MKTERELTLVAINVYCFAYFAKVVMSGCPRPGCRDPGSEPQAEYELGPLFLERFHVVFTQHALECLVSGRIVFGGSMEFVVVLLQQPFLLKVIQEITGLGVICTGIGVVELASCRAAKRLEGRLMVQLQKLTFHPTSRINFGVRWTLR